MSERKKRNPRIGSSFADFLREEGTCESTTARAIKRVRARRTAHKGSATAPKKRIPTFRSDAAAAEFVARADLTQYDLSGATPMRFEVERKTARVNMRLPEPLLAAVKARARARGIPYQRFIREALEDTLRRGRGTE